MKNFDILAWSGTALGTVFTAIQDNQIFQWISFGLTILSTLFAIAYTAWKWYRKAKEDGKITEDEVDELMDDVNDIVNKDKEKED